jgi:NADP-dependent 3-hydroxy acid dehydrogenase YdfG
MNSTPRTSAEAFEEYIPGALLAEHRAQTSGDVFVQILARRQAQEDIIISDIASLKVEEWHRMVDVNVKGLFNTVAAVLPIMRAQKSGHMINTSSIAGRKTFAGLGVYCATKHAVAAFSDILRMEVAPKYNIRVTSLQPGGVESELFEHITDENYRAQMEQLKEQMKFMKSEDIADSIIYALQAPDHADVAELFIMPTEQPW